MPKLRKTRLRRKFQFGRNRKRVRNNRTKTGNIKLPDVKKHWQDKQTVRGNLFHMGLAMDPNKAVQMPNTKQERLKLIKLVNGFVEEDIVDSRKRNSKPRREFVAEDLEKDANMLREPQLRLPKGYVAHLSYFLDNYQLNYKAMVKDRKNYDQYTWKQFRSKIRKFMGITEQFGEYLKSRNLNLNSLSWEECFSDDEC